MNFRVFSKMLLVCFLPIPFFVTCTHVSDRPAPNAQERIVQPLPEHVEVPETNIPEIPDLPDAAQEETPDPQFWDVSDVDISEIDQTRKLISFTFDDAPARSLERILAVFTNFNENNPDCRASATVFCNGHFFDNSSAHALQAACLIGWELGNHSYSHPDLTTLSASEIQKEIDDTETLLSDIDGKREHLFRAPFGRINDDVKSAVNVPIMDWTIDTLDWTGASADDIYNTVFTQKFSGAIVLMHDGYDNTIAALKRLLPDLKQAGYQVTSISKMAKTHTCPLRRGGVYIRARKNGVG